MWLTGSVQLDDFLETNRDFWFHGAASVSDRGTLLLLDRSEDVLAPLMHETTYQAMVHDVLGLESGGVVRGRAAVRWRAAVASHPASAVRVRGGAE